MSNNPKNNTTGWNEQNSIWRNDMRIDTVPKNTYEWTYRRLETGVRQLASGVRMIAGATLHRQNNDGDDVCIGGVELSFASGEEVGWLATYNLEGVQKAAKFHTLLAGKEWIASLVYKQVKDIVMDFPPCKATWLYPRTSDHSENFHELWSMPANGDSGRRLGDVRCTERAKLPYMARTIADTNPTFFETEEDAEQWMLRQTNAMVTSNLIASKQEETTKPEHSELQCSNPEKSKPDYQTGGMFFEWLKYEDWLFLREKETCNVCGSVECLSDGAYTVTTVARLKSLERAITSPRRFCVLAEAQEWVYENARRERQLSHDYYARIKALQNGKE
jgi:hypothetical protein